LLTQRNPGADQATISLVACDHGAAPLTDDDPHMTKTPAPPERQAVLIGGESLLIECAQTLQSAGFGIAAVVSRAPAVRRWAASNQLALFSEPSQLLSAEAPRGFGYLFSITNLDVLAPEVIALPTRAAINFHDGPLPEYAGLNTPVWALLNGEAQHGITWHLMTREVDRGDILAQRRFDLSDSESALTLNTRCFEAAIESFEQVARGLVDGTLVPRAQASAPERMYRRKDRPLAVIDWAQPAAEIARLVRALDFGAYANPVASAKLLTPRAALIVAGAELTEQRSMLPAGTVVAVDAKAVTVATADNDLRLTLLQRTCGGAIDAPSAGLQTGLRLPSPTEAMQQQLDATAEHEPFWQKRLETQEALELSVIDRSSSVMGSTYAQADVAVPAALDPSQRVASVLAWLARCADKSEFDIGFGAEVDSTGLWAAQVPWRASIDFMKGLNTASAHCAAQQQELQRRGSYLRDLVARRPDLRARAVQRDPRVLPVALLLVDRLDDARAEAGSELTIALTRDGARSRWVFDAAKLSAAQIAQLQQQWLALSQAGAAAPERAIAELPLMNEGLQQQVLHGWNAACADGQPQACVHHLFEQQAARQPQRTALVVNGVDISYAELDKRANRVAAQLVALGVGPDALVGLCLPRSIELIVGLLAIHKAGGAYVPLDPAYPRDRITYMLEDAKAAVLITDHEHAPPATAGAKLLLIEDALQVQRGDAHIDGGAKPEHLAYVIYTSGSTGKPKGVMVEHRNVVNFFAGMDQHLDADFAGTWLAVTSLSFDISVLELCWTLARGYTVVIASEDQKLGAGGDIKRGEHANRKLDFSLFYFSADENEGGQDKYKLLLEGAKYADKNGFSAVWTPERHFHAFGGLYPNPAVAGAAVAAVTERIGIRAGSVVLPLHHPARVAEEWSVVDNISKGRVGISFASGWQPNDFALMPGNFADNKNVMLRNIEVVRKLWRGESVAFDGPLGKPVELRTLPRPVQKDLPYWVTSAGNPQTFIDAGRIGANVLTHLLGQTVEELAEKIAAYRKAYKDAGHEGVGFVSLMLHSFVGPDIEAVRATVKQPLIAYLKTSLNLVKQYAWSFPAFKRREGMDAKDQGSVDLQSLAPDEMDALLEYSFERYFEDSGLFGTPESCLSMIDRIKAVGVDDVACLIDFGIASDTVLAHLPHLNTLREQSMPAVTSDASLAQLMQRHRVTHLQCTPSMARMLAADDAARAGLAQLHCMMVGGEAFPPTLARDLAGLVQGKVMNMYGPTETTIWSAVHTVGKDTSGVIPLGKPLANQQIHILDSRLQALPPGVPGELAIGGHGVVRGYFRRPELTAERFVADTIRGQGRLYRTGDLARWRQNDDGSGVLEFLGRLDHQVKVRGYRIELGEIEAALAEQPGVAQAVVMAREDQPGDTRLVAYLVGTKLDGTALREALRARLPDFMLPSAFVMLDEFPHTPNGKIDRKALPAPDAVAATAPAAEFVAPTSDLESQIAEVWKDVLKLAQVGTRDNFFDLGGHSLLAVQAHRRLKEALQRDLSITDIFRFPTIQSLATYLAEGSQGGAQQGSDRAQGRRAAMQRRQQQRSGAAATTTIR
jgi:natural product biosynthesis luciferase-like monooxygenase protein